MIAGLLNARWQPVGSAGPSQAVPDSPSADLSGGPIVCEGTPSNAEVRPGGNLHLFGEIIVSRATYEVRMCDATGSTCSDSLAVATGKWGDVVAPYGGGSQLDFADISVVVDEFRDQPSAPDMPRSDLVGPGDPGHPNAANQVANFQDNSEDVDPFRGFAFPFAVPACP